MVGHGDCRRWSSGGARNVGFCVRTNACEKSAVSSLQSKGGRKKCELESSETAPRTTRAQKQKIAARKSVRNEARGGAGFIEAVWQVWESTKCGPMRPTKPWSSSSSFCLA